MKRLIPDYLDATASLFPEQAAFTDPQQSISFRDLLSQVRRIASGLIPHAHPRSIICFYMDKSVRTICGFFGAVYAGCAYSQLNLRHPGPRILSIIETTQTPLVVTDSEHLNALREFGYVGPVLLIDDLKGSRHLSPQCH